MAKETLSSAGRFLILERDNFTCQYCGKKPPEVILEVDHIKPRKNGGGDDSTNLITACFNCNRGKNIKETRAIPTPKEISLPSNENFHYPVYGARVEQELKNWLRSEQNKYPSQNLFFKELKKRYEAKNV